MADDTIISADSNMTEPPDLWVERITPWRPGHSREVIARDFKAVPDDVRSRMVGETAAKLYGLLG
jgi:hypothetical protein